MRQSYLFPWQEEPWRLMVDMIHQGRLPHALLLTGPQGIGKKTLAFQIAHHILCQKKDHASSPCGACHACSLMKASSHPDLIEIQSNVGHAIKIDDIRSMLDRVSETGMIGNNKVVLIHPAEMMNLFAANALLKTLEEPSLHTFFILVSHQGLRMPATIVSRCQKITLMKPSREKALVWLKEKLPEEAEEKRAELLDIAEGAPLKALQWIKEGVIALRDELIQGFHLLSEKKEDPLKLAGKWHEKDCRLILQLLLQWGRGLLRSRLLHQTTLHHQAMYSSMGSTLSSDKILRYITLLERSYADLMKGYNLNRQLMLEELLIYWTRYVSC